MYNEYSYKKSNNISKTFAYKIPTQLTQYLDLVDDEDKKYLEQEIINAEKIIAFKRSKTGHYSNDPWVYSHDKMMHLREYQINTVNLMMNSKRTLNASDTRLGKTVMTLKLFQRKNIKKVVVFAPLQSLESSWDPKIKQWTDYPTYIMNGYSKAKNIKIIAEWKQADTGILISNYEKLDIIIDSMDEDTGIIIDESHKFRTNDKNRKSLNFRFKEMCKIFHNNELQLLSATPTARGSEEFFSQLKMLDPFTFGDWLMFLNRLFNYDIGTFGSFDVVGIKHSRKQEFKDLLDMYCVQDTQDILDYLPKKVSKKITLEMSSEVEHHHNNVVNYMETWFDKDTLIMDCQSTAVGLAKLTGFLLDPKFYPNPKFEALQDIILEHIDTPIVVFSRFTEPLESWVNEFNNRGFEAEMYTGNTKDKIGIYNNFQKRKYDVLFCSYAAKEAIDLDTSHVVVFLARDYLQIHNEQAGERIFPTTKARAKEKLYYYDIVYKNSIEEKIFEILTARDKATKPVNKYKTMSEFFQ